jgi:hypothetical protein
MKSDDGHKVLQGLAGLAAGRGLGCLVLQTQQEVSQRRSLWDYESDTSVFGFSCCEHRRRSRTGKFGDIRSVSPDFARFAERDGNAYHHCRKIIAGKSRGITLGAGVMRRNWQNDQGADKSHSGQEMKTLFAIRYSLFAHSDRRSNV